jgi:hypothetical protein
MSCYGNPVLARQILPDGGHGDGEGPLGDALMAFAIN